MDAKAWTGDDDRDLDPDYELDTCHRCGADWNEPCTDFCDCHHCIGKRARQAAREAAERGDAA